MFKNFSRNSADENANSNVVPLAPQDSKVIAAQEKAASDQQELIEAIFWSLYNPEWKQKIQKQLKLVQQKLRQADGGESKPRQEAA